MGDGGTAGTSRRRTLGALGAVGAAAAAGMIGLGPGLGRERSRPGGPVRPQPPGDRAGTGPAVGVDTSSAAGRSPVRIENARPGRAGFRLTGHRFSTDRQGRIAGYVSATSVAPGGTLDFFVSVASAQRYRITIFRIGHYRGAGAREVLTGPWLDGMAQPPPDKSPGTGAVSCSWTRSWRMTVGTDWVSGYHVALLRNSAGYHQWIPFVVRDPDRRSAGLVVIPTSTYQAYNGWPRDGRTGASLYNGYDPDGHWGGDDRAFAVSHDRPYGGDGITRQAHHDIGFVQWVEEQGHDLTYATSEDLHTGRADPGQHRAVIFPGHDEYWSTPMRAGVTAARDQGTSLVFLGANNCYWRIRYGTDDSDERLIRCAKTGRAAGDPNPPTIRWRSTGDPEQTLIGTQYVSIVDGSAPLVVRDSGHWFWAGTGVRDGEPIPGVVLGEADQRMRGIRLPSATERTLLAVSPFTRHGRTFQQHTHLYRAASGAWVFAAGSLGWTRALRPGPLGDPRLRRATGNLLARLLG